MVFIQAFNAGAGPTEPPPPKLHVGSPVSASKMEGKGDFTQNAIFIRFYISCIFVQLLMNEPDRYVFTQNAIASDFAFTLELPYFQYAEEGQVL